MSIGFVENAGLGPCELQDPAWAKMSALATGVNKKRKKSETKPQAQINKCNNEKRRREQENIYIEELAELISANFADMSSLSVKPDKCAILQETVNQIRSIKQRESASQSSDPVQQGEVSSSRPTILSNEVYGPLLLEALEGFLFVVNAEGKVEHVTENVSNYIKFTRDEIFGESIYNFIHLGDHTRFTTSLMPVLGWGGESTTTTTRSRSFSVRFLVKPPDDQNETVEEKQQRINSYELMHISSTQLRDQVTLSEDEGGESGPYLLCVASRISHRDKVISGIEQFTTKLDTSGKIIGVDVSGVSAQYSQFIKKELMDRALRDLVFQQDVHKLNTHLKETIHTGQATSAVYRLQLGQDKYVQVQTKSKLFKTNPHNSTDIDFIMATHSIVGEYDATGPSDPGGGGTSSVGGPLMTSVVNGTRNGTAPVSSGSDSSTASSNALMNTGNTSSFTTYTIDNDFSFDIFPTSTFDLEPSNWTTEPRPDSRQSVTPVSTPTPRPPSNPAYSPATTVAQSPLAPFVTQPSPSTPAAPVSYTNTFPFSPLSEQNYNVEEPKDTKANVLEEASSMMADSARLRNLLTKPPTVADSSANDADGRNKNRILKGLLNQQDEDDNRSDNRTSPRGLINRGPVAGPSELPKTSTTGGNNMLLQLLNERSDDDDNLEARAGVRKKSELLHQLLKTENRENEDEKKNDVQSHDDTLLRSLGFTSSPSPPSGEPGRSRKRPSDDRDETVSSKRTSDGSQVSSTGAGTGSKLCEKNKMLASLLAKTPNNQQPIPHIPVSLMSATPQDILPRISLPEPPKTSKPMPTRSTTSVTQQRTVVKNTLPDNMSRMAGRPPTTNYLTTMLTHPNSMHHQRTADNRQIGQVDSGSFTSPATSSTDGNIDTSVWVDNNNVHSCNDPLLSDILDQVMDIVPDEVGRSFSAGEGQQPNNFQMELTEKMAINIIQKSLMQCESAVKSPSSPTITLPGTPPAYTPAAMTTQNNQMRPFQPPPNYPQASFISKQRIPVRPGAPQYAATSGAITSNQQLLIQRRQQEEKRRLLQQQQQQELLIPSNATAAEINSGLQNIDSLLNNTVAPNVSLQRSASLPESQLSPNYGGQLNQQNQRLNSQQPYSPHSQLVSPIGQQPGFPQTSAANYQQAARLSPQFNQQMSLRQAYPQGNAQGQNWQQNQARLSLQNPMLNAQLTRAPNQPLQSQQQQQQQQQRALNSPGTVNSRHSPYQQDSFPPPTSPNSAAFNQNQYLRLQRANSVPTATTQLPGGLGSPRPYGREHHPHPYPPIPPNPHQHPMMYQQDSSQYCYDQTGLQLAYNGADRGRAPPHLQAGVSASGPTSEFVRRELRAVVDARTGQAQTAPNRTQPQLHNHDLDSLGLSFEMPTSGASDSPKLWGTIGSDMGSMSPQPATSRSTMEEARPGDHSNKSSLLQKLLSE